MPQAILLQDVENARRARHGRRRLEGLPAQLPDPAQARRARHQGLDRRRRSAASEAAERAVADATERAQENAELLNRTVLTIAAPGRRRRPPVRLRHVAGHRRRDQGGPRHHDRPPQGPPRRADPARSARAWSRSRSPTASSRPSRPWSSSRSNAADALRRRLRDDRRGRSPERSRNGRVDLAGASGRRPRLDRPDERSRPNQRPRLALRRAAPRTVRRADRAAAEPRGRAVGARRGPAVGHGAARADHRRAPPPGGLLPRGHGRIYQAMLDLHTVGEPVDALTLVEHLKQAGELDARRRPRRGRPAGGLRPGRRQRPPVRAHRARERDAPPPPARLLRDPGARALPRGAAARPRRHGRARDPRGRPRGHAARTSARSTTCSTPSSTSSSSSRARARRSPAPPSGLRGPRHHHRRLPARQPDHPRRAPVDGQVGADGQLRRERGARRPRRPSRCSRSRCRSPSSRSASSPRRRRSRATTCARARCRSRAGRRSSQASNRLAESPLYIDDSSDLSVLDVRAKSRRLAQQNADGLGLILIDYLQLMRATRRGRQPRRADRPDLARAEDARARARGAR